MPVRSGGKRDKPSGGGALGEFIDFYRTEKLAELAVVERTDFAHIWFRYN